MKMCFVEGLEGKVGFCGSVFLNPKPFKIHLINYTHAFRPYIKRVIVIRLNKGSTDQREWSYYDNTISSNTCNPHVLNSACMYFSNEYINNYYMSL